MNSATELTQLRLREVLLYDPLSGSFTRLIAMTTSFRHLVGKTCGSRTSNGYRNVLIDGHGYYMHRLAWLYVYGCWPKGVIDHINGVRDDNRLVNLRDVSCAVNSQNMRAPNARNSTGVLGVARSGAEAFTAQITLNGRARYLGRFSSKDDAHAAYVEAKRAIHPGGTL